VSTLLLGAACFARSSENLHCWLLENRILGPHIRQWEESGSMSSGAKFFALMTIFVGGGISIYKAKRPRTKVMLSALLIVPVTIILTIKTSDSKIIVKKHPSSH
jgi:uncharacterized membrane protein YbaN (DUF454 family)